MERSLPTDPPDEPVNRIKEFFQFGGIYEHVTHAIVTFTPFRESDRAALEQRLAALSKSYEEKPENLETVLEIARIYFTLGKFADARQYFEWAMEIAPITTKPNFTRIISLLKKMADDESEENTPPH